MTKMFDSNATCLKCRRSVKPLGQRFRLVRIKIDGEEAVAVEHVDCDAAWEDKDVFKEHRETEGFAGGLAKADGTIHIFRRSKY